MSETDASWLSVHDTYTRIGLTDPDAPAQASGEIAVAAAPETIWAVLTDVTRWPEIRSDIHNVAMQGRVEPDALFTWSTQGVNLISRFGLVNPAREITWSTTTTGLVMTVHYLLERQDDGSTRVRCREALAAPMYPQAGGDEELRARIRTWLEGLKAVVERTARTD